MNSEFSNDKDDENKILRLARLAMPVNDSRDHVYGPQDAPVTLVEYADFQSKLCAEAFEVLSEVKSWMRGQIRFVFRHFPIAHTPSWKAAQAAEAAARQGKFWEMHDRLFKFWNKIEETLIIEYAADLGLEIKNFERDLRSGEIAERIREDLQWGAESGVRETPAFFINDSPYRGVCETDALMEAILEAGEKRLREKNHSRFSRGN